MPKPSETHAWKRFWCPREGRLVFDAHGFLLDPEQQGRTRITDAASFEEIRNIPCLLLVGEPGMGKSHVIEQLGSEKPTDRQFVERVLLTDLRFHRNPQTDIFQHPAFQEWIKGACRLRLFIDSLDECAEKDFARQLVGKLREGHIKNLWLRIACRTAELPPFLEDELRKLWQSETLVRVFELAPLRRKDVEIAAGEDARRFVDEVIRREAVSLAIKPITLRFLLRAYQPHRGLLNRRWDLYSEGCRILAEESSKTRRADAPRSTARLAVATRIAAACTLGQKVAIQMAPNLGDVPADALYADDLAGGTEEIHHHVDRAIIHETLCTSLFSGRGPERMGIAHQTYAEFLTARFLHARKLDVDGLMHVLSIGGRIVPGLHEVAAWVASIDEGFRRAILKSDPLVLMRSDMAMAGDAEKGALVEALFQRIDAREMIDLVRESYVRLKHPRLHEQLGPRIADRGAYFMVRRAAMNIAAACEVRTLQTLLADVALDENDDVHLRAQAAAAATSIGDDDTLKRLRPLAEGRCGEDPDDQLKGYALGALWPKFMDAETLFACITPIKQKNFYGSYQAFLRRDVMEHLADDDLPIALAWAATLSPRSEYDWTFEGLSDEIVERAWKTTQNTGVLDALVQLARVRLEGFGGLFYHQKDGPSRFVPADVAKKRFVRAYIERGSDSLPQYAMLRGAGLLPKNTLTWMLKKLGASSSARLRSRWSAFIRDGWKHDVLTVDRNGQGQSTLTAQLVELILDARKRHRELRAALGPYFIKMDLEDPAVRQLQNNWLEVQDKEKRRHESSSAPPKRPTREESIEKCLAGIESGQVRDFWWLPFALWQNKFGGTDYSSQPDITTSPGWENANEETRERILHAARSFIRRRGPKPDEWLGKNVVYWPAVAGYLAIWLLYKEKSQWFEQISDALWKRWAAIVVSYRPALHDDAEVETKRALVKRAYRAAPNECRNILRRHLDAKIDLDDSDADNIPLLDACWDDAIGALMLDRAGNASTKPRLLASIVGQAIQHGTPGAREHVETLLGLPIPEDAATRERIKSVASAIFRNAPDAGWPIVWPVLQAEPDLGRSIMLDVVNLVAWGNTALWRRLSEDDAADAYIWLEQQFPPKDDPDLFPAKMRSVGPRESLAWARGNLLKDLAERGTKDSIKALERILQSLPGNDRISWALIRAREVTLQRTWRPLRLDEVIKLGVALVRVAMDSTVMNILHLSDLHFDKLEQAILWHGQLAADLREMNCEKLHAIVLSGDLTQRASKDEFDAAAHFIELVAQQFSLALSQFVVVPGNHDLSWDESKKSYELKYRRDLPSPPGDGTFYPHSAEVIEVVDGLKGQKRFENFSQFYRQVSGQPYALDFAHQFDLVDFPDENVLFLGLNSAWEIDHRFTKRAGIHLLALTRALNKIRATDSWKDRRKIAVWHHPLQSSGEDRIKDDEFLDQLAKEGFRIVLHGHIHKPQRVIIPYDGYSTGRHLHVLSAGTFGAPTHEWVPGFPLQYQLIKLSADKVMVETRKREKPGGAWMPDARWPNGPGRDPVPRYELPL